MTLKHKHTLSNDKSLFVKMKNILPFLH